LTSGSADTPEACCTQRQGPHNVLEEGPHDKSRRSCRRASSHPPPAGNQDDFDDNTNLMQLGLDKEDIEELIFRLEDQLGLTAFTAEEDRILKTARTANDLTRFLIEIGRY
jgi:acyl carrier protein